jgi:hypothetical protein
MDNNEGERIFLAKMAAEVRRNPDERLKKLVEYCEGMASVLEQCLGHRPDQQNHTAVNGSRIFLDLNFMMNALEPVPDHDDVTPWSEQDRFRVWMHYELDAKEGKIRILPKVIWAKDGSVNENVDLSEMAIYFPVPESLPEPEPSSIIMP